MLLIVARSKEANRMRKYIEWIEEAENITQEALDKVEKSIKNGCVFSKRYLEIFNTDVDKAFVEAYKEKGLIGRGREYGVDIGERYNEE